MQDTFELHRGVLGAARLIEEAGRRLTLTVGEILDVPASLFIANEDEVPGLHEAHGWGMMGGIEDASEDILGDWVGAEGSYVAAAEDRLVETPFLFGREVAVRGSVSTLPRRTFCGTVNFRRADGRRPS